MGPLEARLPDHGPRGFAVEMRSGLGVKVEPNAALKMACKWVAIASCGPVVQMIGHLHLVVAIRTIGTAHRQFFRLGNLDGMWVTNRPPQGTYL
jgi:hypothetical protein